jgi:hypothetical protein
MRHRKSVALAERGKNFVLVGDEARAVVHAGGEPGRRVVGQHQQWQILVRLADQRHHFLARSRKGDALDVEPCGQLRKRGQHAFHQRAMPAVEGSARIGGVGEARLQQKQLVALERHWVPPGVRLFTLSGAPAKAPHRLDAPMPPCILSNSH